MTLTSVLLAKSSGSSGKIIPDPSILQLQSAKSVHVLAFTSHGELIVTESEGRFSILEWNDIHDVARRLCCGEHTSDEDDSMQDEGSGGHAGGSMMMFVKSVLAEKVGNDLHWKA